MSVQKDGAIPSLDGIRALSITIVFLAHARVAPLPGGFGVIIFFFLSGFLITTLFYREAERDGGINMKAFYIRRLLRLSPPLFTTLLLTYGLIALGVFRGTLAPGAIFSQVFYYFNYYKAFVPNSTEGAYGLTVLWSLSVEEHFYLIYPAMFVLLLRGRLTLTHMIGLLVGILVWRLVRVMVFDTSSATIYLSTDTRFDSILYGAVLAILNARGLSERIFPQTSRGRNLSMLAALTVIVLCFVIREDTFRDTWRYSLLGAALTPLFYYAISHPGLAVFRPLNWAPVRRIGIYSYTIYLAHTVVLGNLTEWGVIPGGTLPVALVSAVICMAYAAFLLHYIERPVREMRGLLMARLARP